MKVFVGVSVCCVFLISCVKCWYYYMRIRHVLCLSYFFFSNADFVVGGGGAGGGREGGRKGV